MTLTALAPRRPLLFSCAIPTPLRRWTRRRGAAATFAGRGRRLGGVGSGPTGVIAAMACPVGSPVALPPRLRAEGSCRVDAGSRR